LNAPVAQLERATLRHALRWEMFYRLKSEFLSEHLDLVVAQLAITEIGPGVPIWFGFAKQAL